MIFLTCFYRSLGNTQFYDVFDAEKRKTRFMMYVGANQEATLNASQTCVGPECAQTKGVYIGGPPPPPPMSVATRCTPNLRGAVGGNTSFLSEITQTNLKPVGCRENLTCLQRNEVGCTRVQRCC